MTLWESAVETLLMVEGGYVNNPDDRGGETNWGISKRAYPHLNIETLSREHAIGLYEIDYWRRIPAGLPDDLHWMAFDAAVNHGVARAIEWLPAHPTLASYTAHRLRFLADLVQWPTFGRGWTRRVAHTLEAIDAWTVKHGRREVAQAAVLHGLRLSDRWVALTTDPVTLRGRFVVTSRPGKVDVRREA